MPDNASIWNNHETRLRQEKKRKERRTLKKKCGKDEKLQKLWGDRVSHLIDLYLSSLFLSLSLSLSPTLVLCVHSTSTRLAYKLGGVFEISCPRGPDSTRLKTLSSPTFPGLRPLSYLVAATLALSSFPRFFFRYSKRLLPKPQKQKGAKKNKHTGRSVFPPTAAASSPLSHAPRPSSLDVFRGLRPHLRRGVPRPLPLVDDSQG